MSQATIANDERRRTIEIVRVLGILAVIYIHSYFTGEETHPVSLWVKAFVGAGAVPLFFLLSGYLAGPKLISRAVPIQKAAVSIGRTLVVPYLFWNTAIFAMLWAAKASGASDSIGGAGAYFGVDLSLRTAPEVILGIGRDPIQYQLWFLRDLIIVAIAALLIRPWLKYTVVPAVVLICLPSPMACAFGYYLIGVHIASMGWSPERIRTDIALTQMAVWFGVGVCAAVGLVAIPQPILQIGSAMTLVELAAVLGKLSVGHVIARWGVGMFFVYASHEPLQLLMTRVMEKLGAPGADTLVSFLWIPLAVFTICLSTYYVIRRVWPQSLVVLTGGR